MTDIVIEPNQQFLLKMIYNTMKKFAFTKEDIKIAIKKVIDDIEKGNYKKRIFLKF